MRYKIIRVSYDIIEMVLRCGWDQLALYGLEGSVPSDLKVVRTFEDASYPGEVSLVVESAEFEAVKPGMRLGFFELRFRKAWSPSPEYEELKARLEQHHNVRTPSGDL